jgi:hypothetical protein
MTAAVMPRYEREDLQRLVRQREKVLKSAAKQRSADLLADFENQMGQQYAFDDDEIWEQAVKSVEPVLRKARAQIAARCHELGIPARFAPSLDVSWSGRGYDNSIERRKAELRRMAQTQVAAIEAKAIVQIGVSCLEAQTALAVTGITSDAGRRFVEALPKIEALMPRLSFSEVAGDAQPPVAEQLVSSHALRQRRYRERLAARRHSGDGHEASRDASCDASGITADDGLSEEAT